MGQVVSVLYKEFYSFVDKESGELVTGGKVQCHDPKSYVNSRGRVGAPAFTLKADFTVSSMIPDDKIPGKYELDIARIPTKNGCEERITAAKFIG